MVRAMDRWKRSTSAAKHSSRFEWVAEALVFDRRWMLQSQAVDKELYCAYTGHPLLKEGEKG